MTPQALPMFLRLFAVALAVAIFASSSAIAEVPESRARFTDLYAEAVRRVMPAAKVQTIGELEVRVQIPDGGTATYYLDNAYDMYRKAPERRDAIIAYYIERGLKNVTDVDPKIDAARVIPIVRSRASIMIAHAEKNPKSPDAVLFEHLGADLFIIYGENLQRALSFFSVQHFEKTGIPRNELRARAVANFRRIIGTIEYREYGGTYMLVADGANEASLLMLPEVWTKRNINVDGDFVVAIPTRDLLVVTGSNDADGVQRVRALAEKGFSEGPYAISPRLYRFRDGKLTAF